LREYAEARDCYEEVLTSAWASEDERATADEWAEGSAAWLYCEAGQHAEAVTRLERLLARHPEDHPERCAALLALGTCYGALGAAGRARDCYAAVLSSSRASAEQKTDARRRLARLA
jgi:tetratricopeptide (TPR) repeat protein